MSFDSYIKPQQSLRIWNEKGSCMSFDSYIKPQPSGYTVVPFSVVCLLIPTSNHNTKRLHNGFLVLYVF